MQNLLISSGTVTLSNIATPTLFDDNDWTPDTNNNYWKLSSLSDRDTNRTESTTFFVIHDDGSVGIGVASATAKLDVSGKVKSNGNILTSDKRYKKDITALSGLLEKILQLAPKEYRWRQNEFPEKNFSNGLQYGLIAQEVEVLFPDAVSTGSDGFKSLNYNHILVLLLQAIKEQQQLLEQQNARLDAIEQYLNLNQ